MIYVYFFNKYRILTCFRHDFINNELFFLFLLLLLYSNLFEYHIFPRYKGWIFQKMEKGEGHLLLAFNENLRAS